jgi:hypothetical protein
LPDASNKSGYGKDVLDQQARADQINRELPGAIVKSVWVPVVIAGSIYYAPVAVSGIRIVASRALTQKEIVAILAWLSTPQGQKFLEQASDVFQQLPFEFNEADPSPPSTIPGVVVWAAVKANEIIPKLEIRQPSRSRGFSTIDCHRPQEPVFRPLGTISRTAP